MNIKPEKLNEYIRAAQLCDKYPELAEFSICDNFVRFALYEIWTGLEPLYFVGVCCDFFVFVMSDRSMELKYFHTSAIPYTTLIHDAPYISEVFLQKIG